MSLLIVTEDDGSKWVDLKSFKCLYKRMMELHKLACTADNCVIDGGEEHDTAFGIASDAKVCPRCDGIGKHSWLGDPVAGRCTLCKGTGQMPDTEGMK